MKTIFVSSTFRDFQRERDVLHDRVLPELNRQARRYGEAVSFCDLRWGVDTSEQLSEDASSAKVLSVCLTEIDRARPYMIVLLGERYGFMPGTQAISRELQRKAMDLEELEISVTALEIEYGALHTAGDLEHTWFYFRELWSDEELPPEYRPESNLHREKLHALKQRIRRLAGDRLRFYRADWNGTHVDGLDGFVSQVTADLRSDLQTEWAAYEALTPQQRDGESQWNYLKEKARSFSVFEPFAENLVGLLEDPASGVIAVQGPSGSGKTTLFARVCQLMSHRGWTVLPYCGGNTERSTDAFDILTGLVWQLEHITGQRHMDLSAESLDDEPGKGSSLLHRWQERLELLCAQAAERENLLIAVDALDQLQESELRDLLGFLPATRSPRVKCLVTCLENHPLPIGTQTISMPVMDTGEQHLMVDGILRSMGKELSQPVVEALLSKAQASNPLYLYLACARLTLMNAEDFQAIREKGDGMDAITAQHLEMIRALPQDLEGLSAALAGAVSQRVQPRLAEAVFRFLAISRRGLRLTDLEALLNREGIAFSQLEFAQMVNYMNELFLLRRDGRFDFLHKTLRMGLRMELKRQGRTRKEEHQILLDHLWTLPADDPIRLRELMWESMEADNPRSFLNGFTWLWHDLDGEPGRLLARDIAAFSRSDGGAWMETCLRSLMDLDCQDLQAWRQAVLQLCFSMAVDLAPRFGDTLDALDLSLRLMGAATDGLERLNREDPSPLVRAALSQCCCTYGKRLRLSGDEALRAQAIPMLERGLALRTQLLAESPSEENQLRLAQLYHALASTYAALNSKENQFKALEYAARALTFCEPVQEKEWARQVVSVSCRMMIASICCKLGDQPHLEEGYSHAAACAEELENLARTAHEFSHLNALCNCYTVLDLICIKLSDLGGNRHREEAVRYARRALDLAEECSRLRPTPETRANLAAAWNNCARACQAQDAVPWDQVLQCLNHSLTLHRALAQELETPKARSAYVNLLGRLGEVFEARAEDGDLLQALEQFQLAAQQADLLSRDTGHPTHIRLYGACVNRAAGICIRLGDQEHLTECLRLLHQALDKLLRTELQDEACCRMCRSLALRGRHAAQLLESEPELAGQEQLYFAQTELDVLRELSRRWEREEYWRDQNQLCYHLGVFLEEQGGEASRAQALALYREEAASGEHLLALAENEDPPDKEKLRALREDLSLTCDRVANRLRALDSSQACVQALNYAERSVALGESLFQETGSAGQAEQLADSWLQLGRIREALPEEGRTLEALHCYQRELELRTKLSQLQPGADSMEAEALACYRLSGICRTLGDPGHLSASRAYSKRDVELSRQLLSLESTPARKRDLCASLIRARLAEEAVGDEAAGRAALDLQRQVLALRTEIASLEPCEKHLQELEDAKEVLRRLTASPPPPSDST